MRVNTLPNYIVGINIIFWEINAFLDLLGKTPVLVVEQLLLVIVYVCLLYLKKTSSVLRISGAIYSTIMFLLSWVIVEIIRSLIYYFASGSYNILDNISSSIYTLAFTSYYLRYQMWLLILNALVISIIGYFYKRNSN